MKPTLFMYPLKPGKLETYKNFVLECTTTRKKEYRDLLQRYGLNNVKIWYHNIVDRDYVIFCHDMSEDGMERLKGWSASTHPFDLWFNEQLLDCYDITDINHAPKQPTFLSEF